jgi:outer membrane murein-binding lipoprotein Lpp
MEKQSVVGHFLTFAVAFSGVLLAQGVEYMRHDAQAQADVSVISSQLSDLRAGVRDGFAGIQAQISGLPDQRAAIQTLTRQATDAASHLSALDARASVDERSIYQSQTDITSLRSDVDSLKRASSAPIRQPR